MKNKAKISLLVLAFLVAGLILALPLALPPLMLRILAAQGFDRATVASIAFTARPPGLTVKGLTLDGTTENVLTRAQLSLMPLDLKVSGLSLTLDLTADDGPVIAGRKIARPDSAGRTDGKPPPFVLPFTLSVEQAHLRIIAKPMTVTLGLDVKSSLTAQGLLTVEGAVRADDPALLLDAAFTAERAPLGDVGGTVTVKNSGFTLPEAQGRDISADIKFFMPAQADTEMDVTATAKSLTVADIPFADAQLEYKGAGQSRHARLDARTRDKAAEISAEAVMKPAEGGALAVDGKIRADGRNLEKISKHLSGSGTLGLSFDGLQDAAGKWQTGRGRLEASFQKLTLGELARNVQGNFTSDIAASPDGTISARTTAPIRLSSDAGAIEIPASATEPVQLRLDTGRKGQLAFSGAIGGLARFKGTHDTAARRGSADITVPSISFTPARQPGSLWPPLAKLAEGVQGSIGGDARLEWNSKGLTSSRGHILIKDMAATQGDITVEGVNALIALDSLAPPALTDQTISIARLDTGLPLTEGLLVLTLAGDRLDVRQMDWTLAKGHLSLEAPFALDLEKTSAALTLKAAGLDLSELFAMADMDGLAATGLLGGQIPVRLDGENVVIADGVLETAEPGVIRYDPKEVPSFLQNPVAGGVIDLKAALRNFSYDHLKMTISGAAGGDQQILLSARGRNPDFYNGSPVNINLNLGGAIDKVLKYNLGAYKIPDAVQKQIEDYEKNRAN